MDYESNLPQERKADIVKLTIFGATGGTGACLVEQAVAAGHEVTAVVRDPGRLAVSPRLAAAGSYAAADRAGGDRPLLRIVTADVMDPAMISPTVAGADAVLSAVGPHGTGPTTVSGHSARSIIGAMRASGVRRLITVSGSIVTDAGEGPFMRFLVKPLARRTALRHVCADMRRGEDEVRESSLDWTIMRPPRLTGGPTTGTYRTALDRNLPRGYAVSRADLAACMLALITDAAAVGRHVGIAY
jgi:putative NADH-flavin reductase